MPLPQPLPLSMLRPCAPHNNVENCFLYQFHTLRKQFDFIASSWLHVQLLKSLRLLSAPVRRPRPFPTASIWSRPLVCSPATFLHMCLLAPLPVAHFDFVCGFSSNSFQLIPCKLLYMPFSLFYTLEGITMNCESICLTYEQTTSIRLR